MADVNGIISDLLTSEFAEGAVQTSEEIGDEGRSFDKEKGFLAGAAERIKNTDFSGNFFQDVGQVVDTTLDVAGEGADRSGEFIQQKAEQAREYIDDANVLERTFGESGVTQVGDKVLETIAKGVTGATQVVASLPGEIVEGVSRVSELGQDVYKNLGGFEGIKKSYDEGGLGSVGSDLFNEGLRGDTTQEKIGLLAGTALDLPFGVGSLAKGVAKAGSKFIGKEVVQEGVESALTTGAKTLADDALEQGSKNAGTLADDVFDGATDSVTATARSTDEVSESIAKAQASSSKIGSVATDNVVQASQTIGQKASSVIEKVAEFASSTYTLGDPIARLSNNIIGKSFDAVNAVGRGISNIGYGAQVVGKPLQLLSGSKAKALGQFGAQFVTAPGARSEFASTVAESMARSRAEEAKDDFNQKYGTNFADDVSFFNFSQEANQRYSNRRKPQSLAQEQTAKQEYADFLKKSIAGFGGTFNITNESDLLEISKDTTGIGELGQVILGSLSTYDAIKRRNIFVNAFNPSFASDYGGQRDAQIDRIAKSLDETGLTQDEKNTLMYGDKESEAYKNLESNISQRQIDAAVQKYKDQTGQELSQLQRQSLREQIEEGEGTIQQILGQIGEESRLGLEIAQPFFTKETQKLFEDASSKGNMITFGSTVGNYIDRVESDIEALEEIDTPQAKEAIELQKEAIGAFTVFLNDGIKKIAENNGGATRISEDILNEYFTTTKGKTTAALSDGLIGRITGKFQEIVSPTAEYLRDYVGDTALYDNNRLSIENQSYLKQLISAGINNAEGLAFMAGTLYLNDKIFGASAKTRNKRAQQLGKSTRFSVQAGAGALAKEGSEELLTEIGTSIISGKPLSAEDYIETFALGAILAGTNAVTESRFYKSVDLANLDPTYRQAHLDIVRNKFPNLQAITPESNMNINESVLDSIVKMHKEDPSAASTIAEGGALHSAIVKTYGDIFQKQINDIESAITTEGVDQNTNGVLTPRSYDSQRFGDKSIVEFTPEYKEINNAFIAQKREEGIATVKSFQEKIAGTGDLPSIVGALNKNVYIDGGKAEITIDGDGRTNTTLRDILPKTVAKGGVQIPIDTLKGDDIVLLTEEINKLNLPDTLKRTIQHLVINRDYRPGVRSTLEGTIVNDLSKFFRNVGNNIYHFAAGKPRYNAVLDKPLETLFDRGDYILEVERQRIRDIGFKLNISLDKDGPFEVYEDKVRRGKKPVDLSQIVEVSEITDGPFIKGTNVPIAYDFRNVVQRPNEEDADFQKRQDKYYEGFKHANFLIWNYNTALNNEQEAYNADTGRKKRNSKQFYDHTNSSVAYKETLERDYGIDADDYLYEIHTDENGKPQYRSDAQKFYVFKITGDLEKDRLLNELHNRSNYLSVNNKEGKKTFAAAFNKYKQILKEEGLTNEQIGEDVHVKMIEDNDGRPSYRGTSIDTFGYALDSMMVNAYPDTEMVKRGSYRKLYVNIFLSIYDGVVPKGKSFDDHVEDKKKEALEIYFKIIKSKNGTLVDAIGLNTYITDKTIASIERSAKLAIMGANKNNYNKKTQSIDLEKLKPYNDDFTNKTNQDNALNGGVASFMSINQRGGVATNLHNKIQKGITAYRFLRNNIMSIDTSGMNIISIEETKKRYSQEELTSRNQFGFEVGRLSAAQEHEQLLRDLKDIIGAQTNPTDLPLPNPEYIIARLATLNFPRDISDLVYYGGAGGKQLSLMSGNFKRAYDNLDLSEGAKKRIKERTKRKKITKEDVLEDVRLLIEKEILNANVTISNELAEYYDDGYALALQQQYGEEFTQEEAYQVFKVFGGKSLGLEPLVFDVNDPESGKYNKFIMDKLYKKFRIPDKKKTLANLKKAFVNQRPRKGKSRIDTVNEKITEARTEGMEKYDTERLSIFNKIISSKNQPGLSRAIKELSDLQETLEDLKSFETQEDFDGKIIQELSINSGRKKKLSTSFNQKDLSTLKDQIGLLVDSGELDLSKANELDELIEEYLQLSIFNSVGKGGIFEEIDGSFFSDIVRIRNKIEDTGSENFPKKRVTYLEGISKEIYNNEKSADEVLVIMLDAYDNKTKSKVKLKNIRDRIKDGIKGLSTGGREKITVLTERGKISDEVKNGLITNKEKNDAIKQIKEDIKKAKSNLKEEKVGLSETEIDIEKGRELLENFDFENYLFNGGQPKLNYLGTKAIPNTYVPVYITTDKKLPAGNFPYYSKSFQGKNIIYVDKEVAGDYHSKLPEQFKNEYNQKTGKTLEADGLTNVEETMFNGKPGDKIIGAVMVSTRGIVNLEITDPVYGRIWSFVDKFIEDKNAAQIISSLIPSVNGEIGSIRQALIDGSNIPGVRRAIIQYAQSKDLLDRSFLFGLFASEGIKVDFEGDFKIDYEKTIDQLAEDIAKESSYNTDILDAAAVEIGELDIQDQENILNGLDVIQERAAEELSLRLEGTKRVEANRIQELSDIQANEQLAIKANENAVVERRAWQSFVNKLVGTSISDIERASPGLKDTSAWFLGRLGERITINGQTLNAHERAIQLNKRIYKANNKEEIAQRIQEEFKNYIRGGLYPSTLEGRIFAGIIEHFQKDIDPTKIPQEVQNMIFNIPDVMSGVDRNGNELKTIGIRAQTFSDLVQFTAGQGSVFEFLGTLNPTDSARLFNNKTTDVSGGIAGVSLRLNNATEKFRHIFGFDSRVPENIIEFYILARTYNSKNSEETIGRIMTRRDNPLVAGTVLVGNSIRQNLKNVFFAEGISGAVRANTSIKMLLSYGFSPFNAASARAVQAFAIWAKYQAYRPDVSRVLSETEYQYIRRQTGLNLDAGDVVAQLSQGVQNVFLDVWARGPILDLLIDKYMLERGITSLKTIIGPDGKLLPGVAQDLNSRVRSGFVNIFGADLNSDLNSRNAGLLRTVLNPLGSWAANQVRNLLSNIGGLGSQRKYVRSLEAGDYNGARAGLYNNYENNLFMGSVLRGLSYMRRFCELEEGIDSQGFGYENDAFNRMLDFGTCDFDVFNNSINLLEVEGVNSSLFFRTMLEAFKTLITDYGQEEHNKLGLAMSKIFTSYGRAMSNNVWIYESFLDGTLKSIQDEDASKFLDVLGSDFGYKMNSLSNYLASDIEQGVYSGRPVARGIRRIFQGSDLATDIKFELKDLANYEGLQLNKTTLRNYILFNIPLVSQFSKFAQDEDVSPFVDFEDPQELYDYILETPILGYNDLINGQFPQETTTNEEYRYVYKLMRHFGPGRVKKNDQGKYDEMSQTDFTDEGERTARYFDSQSIKASNYYLRKQMGDDEYNKFISENLKIDREKPWDDLKKRVYIDALTKYKENVPGAAIQMLGATMSMYEDNRAKALGYFGAGDRKYFENKELVNRVQAELGKAFGEHLYDAEPGVWRNFVSFTLNQRINEQIASGTLEPELATKLDSFTQTIASEDVAGLKGLKGASAVRKQIFNDLMIDKFIETGDLQYAEGFSNSLRNLPSVTNFDPRRFNDDTPDDVKDKINAEYEKADLAFNAFSFGYAMDRLEEAGINTQDATNFALSVIGKDSKYLINGLLDDDVRKRLGEEVANDIAKKVYTTAENASWAEAAKDQLERAVGKLGSGGKGKGKGGRRRSSGRRSGRRGGGGSGRGAGIGAFSSYFSNDPLKAYEIQKSRIKDIKLKQNKLLAKYKPTAKAKFPKFTKNYNKNQLDRLYSRARYESIQSDKLVSREITSQTPKFKIKAPRKQSASKGTTIQSPDQLSGFLDPQFDEIS